MRAFIALLTGIFSFVLIDLNILRHSRFSSKNSTFTSKEFESKKNKNRKRRRTYKNRKYKNRKRYKKKLLKFSGTKSKDHRYSNQKKLRRMYRNV